MYKFFSYEKTIQSHVSFLTSFTRKSDIQNDVQSHN